MQLHVAADKGYQAACIGWHSRLADTLGIHLSTSTARPLTYEYCMQGEGQAASTCAECRAACAATQRVSVSQGSVSSTTLTLLPAAASACLQAQLAFRGSGTGLTLAAADCSSTAC